MNRLSTGYPSNLLTAVIARVHTYLKTPTYPHLVPFGPPVPLPRIAGLSLILFLMVLLISTLVTLVTQ